MTLKIMSLKNDKHLSLYLTDRGFFSNSALHSYYSIDVISKAIGKINNNNNNNIIIIIIIIQVIHTHIR